MNEENARDSLDFCDVKYVPWLEKVRETVNEQKSLKLI